MDKEKMNLAEEELETVVGGVTMNDLNKSYAKAHPVTGHKKTGTGKMAFSMTPEASNGIPFSCPKCHGQFMVDGTSSTVVCPSCGNSVTIAG